MQPFLGLAQPQLGAPLDDVDLVADPVVNETVDRQGTRHPVHQRQHIRRKRVLQLRALIEVIQHHLRHRVALEHNHDARTRTAGSFVADIRDPRQSPVLDQLGNLNDQVVGVDLIGQLGRHQAGSPVQLLDIHHGALHDRAAPTPIGFLYPAPPQNRCSRREIRTLDMPQTRRK